MGIATSVRVIGVDPGLASVGWGVVDRDGARLFYRAHGCISTKADQPMEERLARIRDLLAAVVAEWKPDEAAMEALFFAKNVTSAMGVSEARGVIRLAFRDSRVPLSEYLPAHVKQAATGSGQASKSDMQNFIRMVLGLSEIPKPDHAADALALALCHCNSSRFLAQAGRGR